MTPETLAENVKRLRELNDKRPQDGKIVNFSVSLKQIWDNDACESFKNMTDRACAYGDSIRTINALVQLVGEMSEALGRYQTGVSTSSALMDAWDSARPLILQAPDSTLGREVFEMALDEIEEKATEILTKAKPIAELAKHENNA